MQTPCGQPRVIIVGGGLTGISVALHLKCPWVLLERDEELGGLARTEQRQGFFFDRTGHWLHLRDGKVRAFLTGLMGEALTPVRRRARIYSHGTLTPYPFQANLHGLPPRVVHECLLGFFRSILARRGEPPRDFEQYILHHFGEGIARHFMIPYNHKLWGVHPREITSAWCRRFVPLPDLEQVVAGAVGAAEAVMGYNVEFLYPRKGGIGALVQALAAGLDLTRVRLGAEVQAMDPLRRTVTVGDEELPYDALVTTIPLPALVDRLRGAPQEVCRAARLLRATAVRYLNVASRTPPPEDYHWIYVPEKRLPFYRVGIYSNAMEQMAPPGCSGLYVELASREVPADPEDEIRQVLQALVEVRALRSAADVLFADPREILCAYVVFDEHHEQALACILPYLERHRIYSCGRYGSWTYNAMEDSLLQGREVAARLDALVLAGQAAGTGRREP